MKEKSAKTFPQFALFRSDHVIRQKPLGKTKDLTGRGPFLFAHVAREKVLHGGLSNTTKYLPDTTLFNKSSRTLGSVTSKYGFTWISTISTCTVIPSLFESFRNQAAIEFFRGFPEKRYNTRPTDLPVSGRALPSACEPCQCPVVSGGVLLSLQFMPL